MLAFIVFSLLGIPSWAQADCERDLATEGVIDVTSALQQDVVLIPVYSDVHGKIATLFKSAATLQQRLKTRFPAILIAGDLGAFPYPMRLSTSLRLAEIRSEEDLGFSMYLAEESSKPGHRTLRQQFFEDARDFLRLNAKFYFVRGNHEDHEFLKERELSGKAIIPVDPTATFNYLADGRILNLRALGRTLRLATFGGIHAESRPGRLKHNPFMTFDADASQRLLVAQSEKPEPIDVLLTHQGPDGTTGGHSEIRALVQILKPRTHIHGHADVPGEMKIDQCTSLCVPKLSGVKNKNDGIDAVILEWNIKTNELKVREEF